MSQPNLAQLEAEIIEKSAFVAPLLNELGKAVIGQQELLGGLLIGLLCHGHVLIEGECDNGVNATMGSGFQDAKLKLQSYQLGSQPPRALLFFAKGQELAKTQVFKS